MKRPTPASLKRLTAGNLAALGADRLAEILLSAADGRAELKRRLRMELAAEVGPDHLAAEIDKRLGTLASSRSKVSWRQRATFVRDLDVLRALIAGRLGGLDAAAALERMWLFIDLAPGLEVRVRDKDGEIAAVFERAARDLGALVGQAGEATPAKRLVEALTRNPWDWAEWLPPVLGHAPPSLAQAALREMAGQAAAKPGWIPLIRLLADASGEVDAYRATFTAVALRHPAVAAGVARRMLAAERIEEAGRLLQAATPGAVDKVRADKGRAARVEAEPRDPEWETAWIDYLERSGQADAAQAERWSAFERTLSAELARAFTRRLTDFEDVEAEARAFAYAAGHPDFQRGLRFLMDWPALGDAARMIQARADDLRISAADAELWASRLRGRYPDAAVLLLRKAAADALRRRDHAACDRLTHEAEALAS